MPELDAPFFEQLAQLFADLGELLDDAYHETVGDGTLCAFHLTTARQHARLASEQVQAAHGERFGELVAVNETGDPGASGAAPADGASVRVTANPSTTEASC